MQIAVLSDIHSNLPALEAVLADAGAVDAVWCPGDIVGYGPNPNECIELLRQHQALAIAGNHDWAAIGRLSTGAFNPDAAVAAEWTAQKLTAESRRYLEDLPETVAEGAFTLVHGTLRHPIWEYLASAEEAEATFALLATRHCLVGHTHVPAVFVERAPGQASQGFSPPLERTLPLDAERMIFNPGSVGQPRDGNPDASYIMLDTGAQTIRYRRVPYDVERTQRLMQLYNLPSRLWQRLSYGW